MSAASSATRTQLDPRLRARRIAVKRAQGRHRLRVLVAIFGVLALVGAVWLAVTSPVLDVDRVDVRGAAETDVADIRAASGIEAGDALVWVDVAAAERSVEELPWVEQATVGRRFPDHVVVDVTERTPVAWVRVPGDGQGDAAALVDRTGRVLVVSVEVPTSLPELAGHDEIPEAGATLRSAAGAMVAATLTPELLASVGVVIVNDNEVTLLLTNTTEVRLGSPDELDDKAAAALAMLAYLGDRPVSYVDVRVPSAPTVGPVPVAEAGEAGT